MIDDGYRTVAPVEEWLEAHRHLWSPNTVRGYATSLAQWWSFLEHARREFLTLAGRVITAEGGTPPVPAPGDPAWQSCLTTLVS